MYMNYNRGDIVILPFPFVTQDGMQQKARPGLIISDHSIERRYNDVILADIICSIFYIGHREFQFNRCE